MNHPIEIVLVLFWTGFIGLNAWLMFTAPSAAADAVAEAVAAATTAGTSMPEGERA